MYIVIEIQTYDNGTVGTLVNQYDTLQEAESKFHTVLAAAAVSSLPVHSAMIITGGADTVRAEHYEHEV